MVHSLQYSIIRDNRSPFSGADI
ncbi:hypothetical protein F01_140250 [Burkholderia cenocepacia]|nr:hypothetical protein F01_140250 [Burkholderia cenocepacia]